MVRPPCLRPGPAENENVTGSTHNRWLLWAMALSPSVLLRLYPSIPLASDEKVFAVAAREIAGGAVLYRDVFDHKGPALYWAINLFQGIFGSYTGVRVLAILMALVLQLAVFYTVRRFTRNEVAAFGSAFAIGLAAWQTNRIFSVELLMVAPMAAALALLLCSSTIWAAALAGALCGFAVMVKPTAGLDIAMIALLLCLLPGTSKVQRLAASAFGVGIVSVLFLLPFRQAGAIDDLVDLLFRFNSYYSKERPYTVAIPIWLAKQAVITCYLWIPALLMLRSPSESTSGSDLGKDRARLILFLWSAVALASALMGRRPFNHYLLQPYLPMSLLLGLWLAGVRMPVFRPKPAMAAVWLLAFALFGFYHASTLRADEIRYAMTEKQVAHEIDAATGPNERIYVWGNATDIYYFSGRQPAMRYLFYPPFRGKYGQEAPAFEQAYWERWCEDFDRAKPDVIIDCSQTVWNDLPWLDPYRNPDLGARLASDYKQTQDIHGFRIYRRVNGAQNAFLSTTAN